MLHPVDLARLLAAGGGVMRRSDLGRGVAARRTIAEGLASGALRDIGRGWLAMADADPAIVAARQLGATVSCISAASLYGLAQLSVPKQPHVAVPRNRGRRSVETGARVHREPVWTPPEQWPVAPVAEVAARALRCLPSTEAIVIVDSALNKGLVTAAQLEGRLLGRGGPAARASLARCDSRSRSPTETLARLALEDAHLAVDAGVLISGVGEVDLLVADRVVVECDGFAYHSGRHEYREDRRRDRALAAMGYITLRFTWEDVMAGPRTVVDAVLAVLAR